ncbi:FAD-dependent oxidoreductase [Dictyobacter sp. S3.2.2.5]|uniref:FAD-dependent oxidoreductase n=1 Tax=Dictyobacter halimunensis TaxID=3026934 RepID=A0ABQ6FQ50_9CHLR|nr:FAD-dependent oxidoreductase [Dictyobacter sp. S3.2.2.5]
MRERQTDILIAGGGLGGVAAALAALRLGKRVILTEETDWIGGQLTAQAVPPDENRWIEQEGCTASYRCLREGIRAYYRRNYPLRPVIKDQSTLNPGQGGVSRLCHEPRVALAVLEEMLAPYRASRQIEVFLHHRLVAAERDGDRLEALTIQDDQTGEQTVIHAPYILDATELGDVLPLADIEYVIGAESQAQTGELHALVGEAQPLDQQAVSWCFALDYLPDEDHTIARPEDYEFWRRYQADFWPGPQLGWIDCDPVTLKTRHRAIFDGDTDREQGQDLWHYRRIFYRQHYRQGRYPSDITLVNWPQIDYWLGPLLGVSDEEKQKHVRGARQLSLSMLYWMQTEAPRLDGGYGYRGLRLRNDIMGTTDGLAKSLYIRESRRIKAEFTVLEQHVGVQARAVMGLPEGSELFDDSVGVGSYRIDLHPGTGQRNYVDISSYPFQIPLGALIPQRVENLLPANKNLGVTHITNGCYRLHPVEWNVGEAAGALAVYCLENGVIPRQVRNTPRHLAHFQAMLVNDLGFQLTWNETTRTHEV